MAVISQTHDDDVAGWSLQVCSQVRERNDEEVVLSVCSGVNAPSSLRSSTCDLPVSSFTRTGSSVRATEDTRQEHRNHW